MRSVVKIESVPGSSGRSQRVHMCCERDGGKYEKSEHMFIQGHDQGWLKTDSFIRKRNLILHTIYWLVLFEKQIYGAERHV